MDAVGELGWEEWGERTMCELELEGDGEVLDAPFEVGGEFAKRRCFRDSRMRLSIRKFQKRHRQHV